MYYDIKAAFHDIIELKPVHEKLENTSLKTLIDYTIDGNTIDHNTIISIKDDQIPEVFKATFETAKFIALQTVLRVKGLASSDDFFKRSMDSFQKRVGNGVNPIFVAIHFKHYDLAKTLINKLPPETIAYNAYLRKAHTVLNEDTISVKQINDYNISGEQKSELYEIASVANLANNNSLNAQTHIEEAIKLDDTNKGLIETAMLASALNKDEEKVALYSKMLETDEIEEIKNMFGEDREAIAEIQDESGKSLSDIIDPKKVHEHCQLIKAQTLAQKSIINTTSKGWKLPNNKFININETTSLGNFKGIKCYGYIDYGLKISESFDILQKNLEGGFVARNKGTNGVKSFKGKVFELKTNNDLRLYTNIIYINENNEALIYFDRSGNHNAVEAFALKNKIKYIKI